MSRLLVFLVLVNLYALLVYVLYKKGKLGKDLDLVLGFILMWRTQRGKRAIDRIARPKRLWAPLGDFGIVLTVVAGVLTLLLVILQVVLFALEPRVAAENTPGAEFLLGIPGFNPIIPIGYGILGLAIALVVHEGAHGVLARAGEIKVKSLGLLLAVVPIGAFVEPDDEELERATTRKKLRVFAAGPASNLVLAVVAAVLFSAVFMSATAFEAPAEGVMVRAVSDGAPAIAAGLVPGDVITRIDARDVGGTREFSAVLANRSAGDRVVLQVHSPGAPARTVVVELADRHAYYAANGISPNPDTNRGKAFLGVGFLDSGFVHDYHATLADPLASGRAFGTYLYHPFFSLFVFDPLNEPFRGWIAIEGPLGALPDWAFFVLANSLYWLFWLNLMLGTFNALPAGPLDGGQMLKASLRHALYRRYGVDRSRLVLERPVGSPALTVRGADPETQAKLDRVQVVLKRATWGIGFTILGMLLLPIVGARVVTLFG